MIKLAEKIEGLQQHSANCFIEIASLLGTPRSTDGK